MADHAVVGVGVLVGPEDFIFDVGHGIEHDLGEIGEGVGVARGDFALRESFEDFAEDVVDVQAGVEIAGEGGEIFAEFLGEPFGIEELGFFAGVEDAQREMAGLAKHAALASVGEGAETAGVGGLGLHENLPFV